MDTRALLLGAVISLAACSYSNNSPVTSPNGGEQERLDDSIERDPILDSFERKQPKIRKRVKWNTGTRVHKAEKGKGSYDRKEDKSKKDN